MLGGPTHDWMDIALLTRGPGLYSSQSLYRAGVRMGHHVRLVDYTRCSLLLGKAGMEISLDGQRLDLPHGIIPRIGATLTQQGAALIRHFEGMRVPTTTHSEGLLKARDKLHSLQLLALQGVPVPSSIFADGEADIAWIADQVGGFPCIVKPLESTHGMGVRLVESVEALKRHLHGAFPFDQPLLVQEFIAESRGEDVRVFIVDGEVVGCMRRVARVGEFRSNLHQGGMGYPAELTPAIEAVALQAARTLGLGVAGVDLLESARGPLVLEVNASPGLEGIEGVTGVDIAGHIIAYLERQVAARRAV